MNSLLAWSITEPIRKTTRLVPLRKLDFSLPVGTSEHERIALQGLEDANLDPQSLRAIVDERKHYASLDTYIQMLVGLQAIRLRLSAGSQKGAKHEYVCEGRRLWVYRCPMPKCHLVRKIRKREGHAYCEWCNKRRLCEKAALELSSTRDKESARSTGSVSRSISIP
jgi:hypothetical protein